MTHQIVLFHRNLRLHDNHTIYSFIPDKPKTIIPLFIFHPDQITPRKNHYFSLPAVQFMLKSLLELDETLREECDSRLFIAFGREEEIIHEVLKECSISCVITHEDVTPFSKNRDVETQAVCSKHQVSFRTVWDDYISPPGSILTNDGTPYRVFKPFYEKEMKVKVPKPKLSLDGIRDKFVPKSRKFSWECTWEDIEKVIGMGRDEEQTPLIHPGGRKHALEQLKNLKKTVANYEETRDTPSLHTSELSSAIKFGVVSIREVYWKMADAFGKDSSILRQLHFRDFYAHTLWWRPDLVSESVPFDKKWMTEPLPRTSKQTELYWKLWIEGRTGIPIIDAGMRQMNETGFMHNRVRMLVASLLHKNMGIDWRAGERYFATKLYDYDPASNSGGWQSVNGFGAGALEWFRVMNPWIQQKKFDPDAVYIKQWLPELQSWSAKEIHAWEKAEKPRDGYPSPCVSIPETREAYMTRIHDWLKDIK